MRSRLRLLIGPAMALLGLAIGLFPLVSVWRVSGQVLEELPSLDGVESSDSRHRVSAIADPDFILARRVYEDATVEQLRQALVADGYQSFALHGEVWHAKECCGGYDAAWVSIIDSPDRLGAVQLLVTTADGDIQSTAGLFGAFGLILLTSGAGIAGSGIRRRGDQRAGLRWTRV